MDECRGRWMGKCVRQVGGFEGVWPRVTYDPWPYGRRRCTIAY